MRWPRVAARGQTEPSGKREPADLKPAGIRESVWGINSGELTLNSDGSPRKLLSPE
jgi:hypothetical protein